MAFKNDTQLTGAAGEHLVLSRLLSRGYLAAQAPRGTRKADVLVNFLEGVGLDVDPNMVSQPRQSSYVRTDDWDEEAEKWFENKGQQAA